MVVEIAGCVRPADQAADRSKLGGNKETASGTHLFASSLGAASATRFREDALMRCFRGECGHGEPSGRTSIGGFAIRCLAKPALSVSAKFAEPDPVYCDDFAAALVRP
jgi:hypothetical protein